jgi:hypothetical protein
MAPMQASVRGMLRRCIFGCVVVSWLIAGSNARAQRTSSLSWVRLSGTEDCISTQALAEGVERRLGRRVFVSASQADLSLEGHVERVNRSNEYVATLVVSDRAGRVLGRRTLRVAGEKCGALEASLVLVIAIAIDPGARLSAEPGPDRDLSPEAERMLSQLGLPELTEQQIRDQLAVPDPDAIRPSVAASPAPPTRARAASSAHDSPKTEPAADTRVRIGIGANAELGVLPNLALGAVLGVTLTPTWFWQTEIWITGLLPQREQAGRTAGVARFSFWAGGLAICPPLMPERSIELHACAGARAGVLSARGSAFAETLSHSGAWLEPTLYGGLLVRITGAWSLHTRLGFGVPIVRDTFAYTDELGRVQRLHRARGVGGRVETGLGVSF